jgi:hypothetical protein
MVSSCCKMPHATSAMPMWRLVAGPVVTDWDAWRVPHTPYALGFGQWLATSVSTTALVDIVDVDPKSYRRLSSDATPKYGLCAALHFQRVVHACLHYVFA